MQQYNNKLEFNKQKARWLLHYNPLKTVAQANLLFIQ